MSKKPKKERIVSKQKQAGYTFVRQKEGFSEYTLDLNGLTVLHYEMPGTGVITTNITYPVGASDEIPGESGLAHMLEHMLFKPTKTDIKKKIDSGAMQFERDTGSVLNANTWKDRTTYFFSYPKEYLQKALTVEADRMDNVVISDTEFLPERGNVLSEFDMYNGDPHFALANAMVGAAFLSHPYKHETIGTREDIEDYTAEKLDRFYKLHYRPNNATLMIFGDVSLPDALIAAKETFSHKTNPKLIPAPRVVREPKQEGVRRTEVVRQSNTNMLGLGIKHPGFPEQGWYETALLLDVLTDGPESILHRTLIDTGKAIAIETIHEPTSETNLAIILITLTKGTKHAAVEELVLKTIAALSQKEIMSLLKKTVEHFKTDIFFARGSSLTIAANMTEFAAAGDWTQLLETESKIDAIKPKDIIVCKENLFKKDQMTIGYFIGQA